MPFRSESQRRFMYAKHPKLAQRWEKHTPSKKLPEKVKETVEAPIEKKDFNAEEKFRLVSRLMVHNVIGTKQIWYYARTDQYLMKHLKKAFEMYGQSTFGFQKMGSSSHYSGHEPEVNAIFESIQKQTPKLFSHLLKILDDEEELELLGVYVIALEKWYSQKSLTLAEFKSLIRDENITLFKVLTGPMVMPDVLYRGLHNLKKLPEEGQEVWYTSKRPFTHWSADRGVATDFCFKSSEPGREGIILEAGREQLEKQKVFCWPFSEGAEVTFLASDKYVDEQEYGIFIKQAIKIQDFEICW